MADFLFGSCCVGSLQLPQRRDIAPLRLVSWLFCEVPSMVQQVLKSSHAHCLVEIWHHACLCCLGKPLLLVTRALLPNRSTDSFQWEAGPPYNMKKYTTYRRMMCMIPGISITLETPKVPIGSLLAHAQEVIETLLWDIAAP